MSEPSAVRTSPDIRRWLAEESARKLPFWHLVVVLIFATAPLLYMTGQASQKLDTLIVDVAALRGSQQRHDAAISELRSELAHALRDIEDLEEYNDQLDLWRDFRAKHENAVNMKLWPNSPP
jgi:hypothetical protein